MAVIGRGAPMEDLAATGITVEDPEEEGADLEEDGART